MLKEQLIGTWRLISCEIRRSDGEVKYPYGRQPIGQLMHDSDSNMSVVIMRPGRPQFSVNDKFQGTATEIKAAFDDHDVQPIVQIVYELLSVCVSVGIGPSLAKPHF